MEMIIVKTTILAYSGLSTGLRILLEDSWEGAWEATQEISQAAHFTSLESVLLDPLIFVFIFVFLIVVIALIFFIGWLMFATISFISVSLWNILLPVKRGFKFYYKWFFDKKQRSPAQNAEGVNSTKTQEFIALHFVCTDDKLTTLLMSDR